MEISDLTYKVVAFSEIPDFNTDECVDWAMEMIFLGYDTPPLLTLAGFNKPTNYFEVADFLPTVLASLNLVRKTGSDGMASYCSYYIRKIANSDCIRKNLCLVHKICMAMDHEESIFQFSMLFWAWEDIDDEYPYGSYWENATKENIEDIVIKTARKWLVENSNLYIQPMF